MFSISKLYCKYIVDFLYNKFLSSPVDNNLDDELYNSYLKLEKFINDEFFNL